MRARCIPLLLCAAALLLTGCAGKPLQEPAEPPVPEISDTPAESAAEPPKDERPRIVCMGDSITAGYGVYTNDEMFSAYLQDLLGDRARVIAYGTPGETLHEASVYTSPALNAEADIVLLQFGTNDASPSLFRADAFRESAEALLDTHIDALGAENVAFLLPPCVYPMGGDIASFGMSAQKLDEVRAILTEVCAERDVAVVDLYSVTCDHPEWFPDGVHPNADGNKAIAEAIYATLFAE